MATICFHHTDMDGWSAGYMVGQFDQIDKFIPYSYSGDFPLDEISKGDKVYLVDLSFGDAKGSNGPSTIEAIADLASELIWCDHHESSVQFLEKHPTFTRRFKGFVEESYCGAMLTWMFLSGLEYEQAPRWLQLVNDWDTGIFEDDTSANLNYAICAQAQSPEAPVFDMLEDPTFLEELLKQGAVINSYLKQTHKVGLKRAFEAKLEGLNILALNTAEKGTQLFGDKVDEYDAVLVFQFDGSKYNYSIYSGDGKPEVVDVALKFGGGGHAHAAGFTSKELVLKPKASK